MAFDGLFLYNLIDNIKPILIDSKIDKINQPEKDEIILTLRKDRKNFKFLISSSTNFPRIHFTEISKENPIKAPMFLMVLRKYIMGGRIVAVNQESCDRIITLKIEASDEMGFNSLYSLIIEIMGRHSNITLVKDRDNTVVDSIKHITPDINTYRVLLPGISYVSPPKSKKLDLFNLNYKDFVEYIDNSKLIFDEGFFFKLLTGFSKPISKEFFLNAQDEKLSLSDTKGLFDFTIKKIEEIKSNESFAIYKTEYGIFKDFYSQKLSSLETDNIIINYSSPSKMLDDFFSTKDLQERLLNKSANLQKLIHNNIDRCKKKEMILNNTLTECTKKEDYKIKGDLLTSYIYMLKQGEKSIDLVNFFSENQEEITIKLNENKSPSENIQSYYKKYSKLKKSEEMAKEQLISNKQELDYLTSVLTNILNAEAYKEIEDIKKELIQTGYIKFRNSSKKKVKEKEGKPLHFISSTGKDIYVGKNNIQNDYLSLKFAHKNDIWLHTKNIPGSHVIIKSESIDEATLEEAAITAAYYSQNKANSKVPVDYTQVKNLKKPNGAKPGMVIYYTNKTIYVDPKKFEEINITKK
jgi:predicted ribosome quality control (RQC) complex YloA/Tae2 family protein